jgi:hypothetical protein
MTGFLFEYPLKRSFFVPSQTTNNQPTKLITTMEQSNAPSTKGKGLGMAGMIIGIVALIWSIVPILGAGAIWLALPGTILSVIAFFMAKSGNNPSKGVIITGVILNIVALGLSIYWLMGIMSAAGEINDALHNMADTMNLH